MTEIKFDDGAGYEQYMGKWSRLVADTFLEWMAPAPHLRWLDVGCGNGAFTETIAAHCAPSHIDGVDPSEAQLEFARTRMPSRLAAFHRGDAMALPFPDASFDVAVMPLVIFFVPDPARGVAEMRRVLHHGGIAAAYAWDMEGGGFPYQGLQHEIQELGIAVPQAPSREASRLDVMHTLWTGAGLRNVETRTFTVERTFDSFDDYWTTVLKGPSVSGQLKALRPGVTAALKATMQRYLPADGSGRITYSARANAVKGAVPASPTSTGAR